MTHAVILAGGWGERLWPLSTRTRPKQLLRLDGGDSLVRATLTRIAPLVSVDDTLVLTGASVTDAVASELPEVPVARIVAEPSGRNTAPPIALAARVLLAEDRDAVLVVLPADHVITDDVAFLDAVCLAVRAALSERALVTLGVRPTRPETEYGYIEIGAESPVPGALAVRRFTEKPDGATAAAFLSGARHLWNSGIFVWRADRFLEDVGASLPEVARALDGISSRPGDARFGAEVRRYYECVPSVSVDYGVMEKASGVLVVPVSFGWDDVGAWTALPRVWGATGSGTTTRGEVVLVDADRCIAYAEDGVVAVIGLSDVIVAHTPGATLVCPRDRAPDVRRVAEELKRRGRIES